jgi:hypothetical protein
MNMVYNSSNFCVVQFTGFGEGEAHPAGGYEIMDKNLRREIFLDGKQAECFRHEVAEFISGEPSSDEFDDFLSGYASLMNQTVALH